MNEHDSAAEQVLLEAIEIVVLLSADDVVVRQNAEQQFAAFKLKSALHQQVCDELQHSVDPILNLEQHPQKNLLHKIVKQEIRSQKKQQKIKWGTGLAVLMASSLSLYGYLSLYSVGYLSADLKSKQGQWQTQQLQDGSQLIMRSATAINIHYSPKQRVIELLQGEIYVDVAKDPSRPFRVKTKHGEVQALGTAFSVDLSGKNYTALQMLHSATWVSTNATTQHRPTVAPATQATALHAGQGIDIYSDQLKNLRQIDVANQQLKWQQHLLTVENQPLTTVLAELQQNYRGKIFYAEDLAEIKVHAVLPLDDSAAAVALLGSGLAQIQVLKISPYLIYVYKK